MFYLFIGEDYFSKTIKLEKLKSSLFEKRWEDFNFEIFSAHELELTRLQEEILRIPFKAKKRLILIKEADRLKEPLRNFLCKYIKKQNPNIDFVLYIEREDKKDNFINYIKRYAKKIYFYQKENQSTFKLAKEIDKKNLTNSLKVLHNLLSEGIEPEIIMGGLRYCWQLEPLNYREKIKRFSLLLDCDLSIKTGRLDPIFALERLLFFLCRF
ncbi:MAG: hypothetical protein NC900_00015 [Candidatus Omnitrophica bacterium]|nr:hypothetical protein [Candidatus Omnitrophota bacterium]